MLTRRTTDAPKGVWLAAPNLGYPQYYLNNFHYQVTLPPRPPSEDMVTFKTAKSQIMVIFKAVKSHSLVPQLRGWVREGF